MLNIQFLERRATSVSDGGEKLVASQLISSFLHPCNEGPQSIYMIENDLHCSRHRNSEDHAHRTPDRVPHNTGDIVALIVGRIGAILVTGVGDTLI